MPNSLRRLIYISEQKFGQADSEISVNTIIQASIRNNRQSAISGLLLLHAGYFLQVLEGPMQAVLTTYGRISGDPRHANAKVLQAERATAREFDDWNMCARRITPADDAILDQLALRDTFHPDHISARGALRLLLAVRQIQERTQVAAMAPG